ncbi:hypothetical protein CEXT_595241 [Caerostris extrusa]|uniref:Uncharacterized protein n=1 Tax=Caerostris extrusa TaxID=172846 RepID=A0AAV4RWK5_CAEEX|nr:hypothetical protein CEXT_595241 [Caerostris extrusa]
MVSAKNYRFRPVPLQSSAVEQPSGLFCGVATVCQQAGTKVLNVGKEAFVGLGRGIRLGDGRRHPRGKTRRLLHVLSRPHFAPFCSERKITGSGLSPFQSSAVVKPPSGLFCGVATVCQQVSTKVLNVGEEASVDLDIAEMVECFRFICK